MTSVVQICNMALARLGDEATVSSIDPPEGSTQAEHCAMFYPQALSSLLEMYPWNFATKSAPLALLNIAAPAPWQFAYAMPAGCLRVLQVFDGVQIPGAAQAPYAVEVGGSQPVLLANTPTAWAQFVFLQTDPQRFSPLFVDALSWLLASQLAGPLLKGDAGAAMSKSCLQQFGYIMQMARLSDARQRRVEPTAQPAWIAGR